MVRRIFSSLCSVMAVMGMAGSASAAPPLRVVTTMSTFADLVKQIGGDDVEVAYVASPKFNPHFIEPKPSDVLKVKKADLFIHAGLDLEAWRGPLVDAAGNPEIRYGGSRQIDLSEGIQLMEVPQGAVSRAEGDIHLYGNPHYWVSPLNGRIMAQTIAAKLKEIDPPHAADYEAHLGVFLKKLDDKIAQWKQQAQPIQGKEVIAYHNEWPYLAEFVGIRIEKFLEPKPGIPPTPKQIGFLEIYMKEHNIRVIIQPVYFSTDSSGPLAARVSGKVVTLCQNVGETPEASDYFQLIDYDVRQLVQALGEKS